MYSAARDWCRYSPELRPALSRQRASDCRKIAALGDAWGLTLDALGASYRLLRWVAGPGQRFASAREARFRAAVRALQLARAEHRGLRESEYRALVNSEEHPRVERRKGGQLPLRIPFSPDASGASSGSQSGDGRGSRGSSVASRGRQHR